MGEQLVLEAVKHTHHLRPSEIFTQVLMLLLHSRLANTASRSELQVHCRVVSVLSSPGGSGDNQKVCVLRLIHVANSVLVVMIAVLCSQPHIR